MVVGGGGGVIFSLTSASAPPQARLRLPGHAELHAGRVGEDQLQLDRSGPLHLDPGGPAGASRQGLQLKGPEVRLEVPRQTSFPGLELLNCFSSSGNRFSALINAIIRSSGGLCDTNL